MIKSLHDDLGEKYKIQTTIISDFEKFAAEIEDDSSQCSSLTVILSATSCPVTKQLYHLIVEHCPTTAILSIHDQTCSRPSRDHGIGFPVRASVSDVLPMVMDLRYDFLRHWDHINLVHDDTLDHETVHKFVKGLTTMEIQGVSSPEVTVFHLNGHGYGTPVVYHGNCTTDAGRAAITFNSAHLVQHIEEDPSKMKYFVVIGKSSTIENIVEEVSRLLCEFASIVTWDDVTCHSSFFLIPLSSSSPYHPFIFP